jgi:hypothetical protein
VSQGVWKCDSCHSNNNVGAATCHLCGRSPGSATGEVAVVTHEQLARVERQQPKFVDYRPTITITPTAPPRPVPKPPAVRPKPPAPARPAPPRPATPVRVRSRRSGTGIGCGTWFLILLGIVFVLALLSRHNSGSSGSPARTETVTSKPCPAEVARWLPDGGPGSTEVTRYDAPLHIVTICQDSSGGLYYDGQEKDKPATSDYHISLPATRTSSGFEAVNNGYTYQITGSVLALSNNGAPVTSWPIEPSN